jgi:Mlc titration factor MtfA (ptsG expression regulator)
MEIRFHDKRACDCYRNFVENPADRNNLKKFTKVFSINITQSVLKLHSRLLASKNAWEYNVICGSSDNKIEKLSGTKDKENLVLKTRMIQITDRGQDLSSCWFTVFHEFGHTLLHKNDDVFEGEINETKSSMTTKEKDTNKFANDYLFNGDNLRKDVFSMKNGKLPVMDAAGLAKKHNVHSIFSEYWLHKSQVDRYERVVKIEF